ncbi:hypothetical protein HPB51_023795 [Rhipicephalus microplus]|uniref:Uncharacterized protein n=1 Tax=Rhipicephalus microplus TaxID=6941 RepID=A0A9J6DDC2_RHIMP|nr:hypothetical protein HPB51_023795 [Rhipicephalus microplus]
MTRKSTETFSGMLSGNEPWSRAYRWQVADRAGPCPVLRRLSVPVCYHCVGERRACETSYGKFLVRPHYDLEIVSGKRWKSAILRLLARSFLGPPIRGWRLASNAALVQRLLLALASLCLSLMQCQRYLPVSIQLLLPGTAGVCCIHVSQCCKIMRICLSEVHAIIVIAAFV